MKLKRESLGMVKLAASGTHAFFCLLYIPSRLPGCLTNSGCFLRQQAIVFLVPRRDVVVSEELIEKAEQEESGMM